MSGEPLAAGRPAEPGVDPRLIAGAYRHCALVARRKAKNFYYSFILLPRAQRRALYAVYTFCHSCDAIADGVLSLDQKLAMLEEYDQNLRRMEAGEIPADDAIFLALADSLRRFPVPMRYFHELIEGVMMDLGTSRYETFAELREYCYKVAGVVGLMVIEILGARDMEKAREHAVDLGLAMQLTNIMRDLREDSIRHRIYLPQDELRAAGYTNEELYRGERNRAYLNMMRAQAARAREFFAKGRLLAPLLPRRSRYCPMMISAVYERLLDQMEERGFDVFTHRAALSRPQLWWLTLKVFFKSLLE